MGIGTKMGIDATRKLKGEDFDREWPPLIRMDEATIRKVDRLLKSFNEAAAKS
jgi:4-hydroxy-3-polyprenylbenzoate decarboxylase